MPSPKTDQVRIQQMLDAAQKAIAFTQGKTRQGFDQDEMLSLAVIRLIEILGEAAKNVSPSARNQIPDIPWRQITGTSDRLSHAYFDINLDIIWNIIESELPNLAAKLE